MEWLKLWLKAVRAPFFSASLIPALVGAALSSRVGYFHPMRLFFALTVVVLCQAGANLVNDYFDALGSDLINKRVTPFSGGSRLIQQGLLSRQNYFLGALLIYGTGLVVLLVLSYLYHNITILGLGVSGIILGVIYSTTKTYGMGRGWGELAVGVAFGPLATAGSYLLQANYVIPEAFLAGVPVGFLIMGVLILNEIPDYEADRKVGKLNWVVRAGGSEGKGVWVYLTVICLAYLTVGVGVFLQIFPEKILFSCLTIPLATWIFLKARQFRGDIREIIPAMAGNIGLHFFTGILISIGLWWK